MGITVWRIIAATPALAFSLWVGLAMWALAPGYVSATATWGYPQIVDTSRLRGFVLG